VHVFLIFGIWRVYLRVGSLFHAKLRNPIKVTVDPIFLFSYFTGEISCIVMGSYGVAVTSLRSVQFNMRQGRRGDQVEFSNMMFLVCGLGLLLGAIIASLLA
jgi:hypothetical protein